MTDRKPKNPDTSDARPSSPPVKQKLVAELRAEEVRWFYKKSIAEKQWRPLCGRDSLAIETAFRKHQPMLQVCRRRTASPSSGPKQERIHALEWGEGAVALDEMYGLVYETGVGQGQKSPEADEEKDTLGQNRYRLEPLYWEGSRLYLVRGTWFIEASGGKWQPLDGSSSELTERIEAQHLTMFENQVIGSTKPGPLTKAVHVLKDANEERKPGHGVEVRWFSVDDVLLYSHHSSNVWRYLGLSPSGTRLMRGYRSKARMDDGPVPVTDIIFVIHGIGQKRAQTKIVKKAAMIQEVSNQLLRTHMKNTTSRPLFLPVDWRTDLQLDEHVIEDLTPAHLEHIRGFFNESLMDLVYYASPVHGEKILNGLSGVMNRMYRKFVAHDRQFLSRNGRISLLAHSLGSVIAYDIMSEGAGLRENRDNDRLSLSPRSESRPRLVFPVHHMFCIGSPLGIFLAARQVRGTQILKPPAAAPDFRLHNIYHPADAVAYRIEPLISEVYAKVRPLQIHKVDARNPKPYSSMPNEFLVRHRGSSQNRPLSKEEKSSEIGKSITTAVDAKPKQPKEEPKESVEIVNVPPDQALPYRIDYSIRPNRAVSAYWAAIRAHVSYWESRDVVMYMLTTLYGMPKHPTGKQEAKEKKP